MMIVAGSGAIWLGAAVNSDQSTKVVDDGAFALNDWSFGQLCQLAAVATETINRLVPDTAARVFAETLPTGNKPLQLLTNDYQVRSIHGTSYTRLFNADLLTVVREFATDFEARPRVSMAAPGSAPANRKCLLPKSRKHWDENPYSIAGNQVLDCTVAAC